MGAKRIHTEVLRDGMTRYFDDNYNTLYYSKTDKDGRIIFCDENGIETGDYAEKTGPNEFSVYDRYLTLKGSWVNSGQETIFYDENKIETGRSQNYKGGIHDYSATKHTVSRIDAGRHLRGPRLSGVTNRDYWDTHYSDGILIKSRHPNPFQLAAIVLFGVALFINGITPAWILYVIIAVILFVAIKLLDSMDFDSASNFHPLSVTPDFEIAVLIGLAAAVFLRPRLNSFLYENYYNNRLSVFVLALTIIPVAASAVYKIIDRKNARKD